MSKGPLLPFTVMSSYISLDTGSTIPSMSSVWTPIELGFDSQALNQSQTQCPGHRTGVWYADVPKGLNVKSTQKRIIKCLS